MRSHKALLLFSLLLFLFTFAAQAQKFQDPTKEELQMTSDPKAPGAPAIYLFRESTTDNFNHFVSMYARIKVLTEAGKEWANVEVPYSGNAPHIQARTIHADGTVVPLDGSSVDLLKERSNRRNIHVRVFSMPSVEVGSIIEYRWTIQMSDVHVGGVLNNGQGYLDSALAFQIPYWDLQETIPIRKERYYWNPLGDLERNVIGNQHITHYVNGEIANYLLFSARLPAGVKLVASPNRDYDLTLTDVPAFRVEEHAPPETGLAYHVTFYYSPYLTGADYWAGEGKRWAKDLDHAAEPTETLRGAAAQITAGAATDDDKAMKLYAAVQGLENTTYSKGDTNGVAATPDQVWTTKNGTSDQIALLYLALARTAGLQASAMAVTDRSERIFDPGLLSLDQLSATLVVLHINGKDVYTDPGEKFAPYGQLAWQHQLSSGLLETAAGTSIGAVTPPGLSKDAITGHTAELTIDAEGGMTGTVKVLANGPAALSLRQSASMGGEQKAREIVQSGLPKLLPQGISGEVTEVKGLGTSAGFVEATVKVSGKLGSTSGKRLFVPAFFFATGSSTQFASDAERQYPVDMHYAEQVIDDVVYHAPAGYTVEGQPQAAQIPWPEHGALVIKTQPAPGGLDVKRIFARVFVLLQPQEYAALREFYGKVATADQQQVVFAAGN